MGLLDLGFFSPSSTFTRSWTLDFLRTDWPAHYPHHGSFSLEEDPCGLCKGFGGSKGVNHLPTFFFFFPKKGKKKIAHSTQFPARQFQIGTPVSQRPGHTAPSDKPRCLRNKRGDCSACSSSSRSSLDEFLKAAGMERVGQLGLFTPFVKTAGQRGSRRPGAVPRQDLLTAGP